MVAHVGGARACPSRRLRDASDQPAVTDASLEKGLHIPDPAAVFQGAADNLVILAFSGGGTRAAAFSYGCSSSCGAPRPCNERRDTVRLLDAVSMITGVSGGSFTALA